MNNYRKKLVRAVNVSSLLLLLFLMACGSSSDQKNPKDQTAETSSPNEKFIIRASNSQFLSLTPNNTFVSNQVDPTKAAIFEKINLGNGKCALKAPNGKYVSADKSQRSLLYATKDSCGESETFEIIAVDESRTQIRSSAGKYVCADRTKGDTLVVNRDTAGNWETFDFQKQN
ncbi:MAG: hypothetical protein JWP12_2382 [Bacteroidetes bacterium]|nr:hypothetical protein [Bacteroidota bacterium]